MNKRILNLAIPNIISNLSVPLLGMADIAMLGRLGSEQYIGAISLGSLIFSFIYWMFSFLRMGTSGMTAQSFGEKDDYKSFRIMLRAGIVALFFAFILIIIQDFISFISFIMLNGSEEVEILAHNYFSIRIFAAPATLLLYVFSGWFIGMQNSKFPMYITIFINLVNLAFNYMFIFYFGMNVEGVALGTVMSQYLGLFLAILLFLVKYRRVMVKISLKQVLIKSELIKYMNVNKDFFFRTLCIIMAIATFTNMSASQGDQILAVNTILLQFFYLFSFFADGFAYAAESLTGRFVGERNKEKIDKLLVRIFIWGSGIAVLGSVTFHYGGEFILRILTTDDISIEIAKEYLVWCVYLPVLSFASYIWDGVYIGATESKGLMYSTLIALFIVFFPIILIMYDDNNHYLWLAFISFLFARGVYQTLFYKNIYNFERS
jgi:MATE family multidrug resistance protein